MGNDARRCLILNPVAKGEKAKRFFSSLTELARGWDIKYTKERGDAKNLAKQAVEEGCAVIVCAGGDGTVNEVINGIGMVEGGFERTRIGIIPLGTSNVFARTLKIPLNTQQAWKLVESDKTRVIDLPFAEYTESGEYRRRYFVQLGGAGLDARAVELLSWNLKKKIGWLAYVWAGLKAIRETQPEISLVSENYNVTGRLFLFGNGKYYGGDFNLFPYADQSDGKIDIAFYPVVNYLVALKCSIGLITKNFKDRGGVKYIQLSSFELKTSGRVGFELDGEFVGLLPVRISVIPAGLRVIAP